ncbi:hypothetical protein [Pseudomonas sp. NA-150]|uniref:hypothetical protein n=1 Tax=Pseudomonas sp. NA-150 TaxID=3367525 RepID=UPI0037C9BC74
MEIDLPGRAGKTKACLTAGHNQPEHKKSDTPERLDDLSASTYPQKAEKSPTKAFLISDRPPKDSPIRLRFRFQRDDSAMSYASIIPAPTFTLSIKPLENFGFRVLAVDVENSRLTSEPRMKAFDHFRHSHKDTAHG